MKTRNSGGVGQKIDLEFDIDSLRIRDLADDEEYQEFNKRKSTIYEGLKRNSLNTPAEPDPNADPKEGDSVGKVKADVDYTAKIIHNPIWPKTKNSPTANTLLRQQGKWRLQ